MGEKIVILELTTRVFTKLIFNPFPTQHFAFICTLHTPVNACSCENMHDMVLLKMFAFYPKFLFK